MSNSKRDILIVFDIDETLIQFIDKNAYHYWQEIKDNKPELKRIIDNNLRYKDLGDVKKQVIFFRPGLNEFLEMVRENGRIKLAIWTYGEREYAFDIANLICDEFDLPSDTFIFKYGSEDIDDHDIPKSLEQIWYNPEFGNNFNKFNTFLVDDRFGNLCHKINMNNSILIQAFAPFGETKQREAPTEELLEKAINDPVFGELMSIIDNLLRDIDGCEDEEIEQAFETEAIFAPKCISRKKLDSYVKNYPDDIQLCTIGEVENAASSIKGGSTFGKSGAKKSTFKKSGVKFTFEKSRYTLGKSKTKFTFGKSKTKKGRKSKKRRGKYMLRKSKKRREKR
jgi:hypothetical protein